MKKKLRLKPSFHFRVDKPCTVKILMVAGKWVHMLVETEADADIRWGTTRKISTLEIERDEDGIQ